MTDLKLRSQHPDTLRQLIESALSERLQSIEQGINKTKERLSAFETQYQLTTEEF